MATASQRVANIPELLEAILSPLSPRDLILASRVSRAFKSTIDNSIQTQRKLFFKVQNNHDAEAARVNPLLLHILQLHAPGCSALVFTRVKRSGQSSIFGRGLESYADKPSNTESFGTLEDGSVQIEICSHGQGSFRSTALPGSYRVMQVANSPITLNVGLSDGLIMLVADNGFMAVGQLIDWCCRLLGKN